MPKFKVVLEFQELETHQAVMFIEATDGPAAVLKAHELDRVGKGGWQLESSAQVEDTHLVEVAEATPEELAAWSGPVHE